MQRQGNPVSVDFDCEDVRSAQAIYELRSGEEYVDAKLEVLEVDKAKEQTLGTPVYNPKRRQVQAVARFLGLDKTPFERVGRNVFKRCPGRGHARVRLLVTVRVKEPQSPKRD